MPCVHPPTHTLTLTHTCTGAGISTLAYPLNTARIHMQQRVGGPRLSIGAALRECVAERGGSVLALYRGVWLNASTDHSNRRRAHLEFDQFLHSAVAFVNNFVLICLQSGKCPLPSPTDDD